VDIYVVSMHVDEANDAEEHHIDEEEQEEEEEEPPGEEEAVSSICVLLSTYMYAYMGIWYMYANMWIWIAVVSPFCMVHMCMNVCRNAYILSRGRRYDHVCV
jgi:hypothetical protein